MQDIKLDKTTHDVIFENGDLVLISGLDRVEQQIKIRLLFFYGEWFLNSTFGVRYYEDVLVGNPNFDQIEDMLKAEIADVDSVNEITEFSSNFISSSRQLNVEFTVNTDFGTLEGSEVLI